MVTTVRIGFWFIIGVLVLLSMMSLQFRLAPAELADFALVANGPRWLLAFVGGAFLATAGLQLQNRFVSPPRLLGISTGGIVGAASGYLGTVSAAWAYAALLAPWIGCLLGMVAAGVALHYLPRHSIMGALSCLVLAGIGIFGVSLVKAEPSAARSLAYFAAGDVGHATLANALAASVLLVAAGIFRTVPGAAPLALGVGIGLVGPVAFISWWVPLAEARLTRLAGSGQWVMVAFAGGIVLLAADALQRFAVGGYGFGLNFPLSLVGTPLYLWWCAGLSSRRWVRHTGRVLAVGIGVAALVFSAFAVRTIQQAT